MTNVTHIDSEITIRAARAADMPELARVAGRDTHELPAAPLLVGTVGDRVRAAISLADGSYVADPFHRTSELVEMLKIRADAVEASRNGFTRTRRGRRALALHRAA
jgi:hypothetical protein